MRKGRYTTIDAAKVGQHEIDSPKVSLKYLAAIDNSNGRFKLPSIKSNFDTSTNPSSARKYKIRSKSTIRDGMASIANSELIERGLGNN